MIFSKKSEIELLEGTIRELRKLLSEKESEIKTLELKLSGGRVCGYYCAKCKNGYEMAYNPITGLTYGCLIDCICKDFEQKQV